MTCRATCSKLFSPDGTEVAAGLLLCGAAELAAGLLLCGAAELAAGLLLCGAAELAAGLLLCGAAELAAGLLLCGAAELAAGLLLCGAAELAAGLLLAASFSSAIPPETKLSVCSALDEISAVSDVFSSLDTSGTLGVTALSSSPFIDIDPGALFCGSTPQPVKKSTQITNAAQLFIFPNHFTLLHPFLHGNIGLQTG
ncbi:MAG: hypothetical protein ACOYJR_08225 [Acutalibacteraceae bacterium]